MPQYESLIVDGEARIGTLRSMYGAHAESNFEDTTGLRKAEATIHDAIYRYDQLPGTSVVAATKIIGVVRQKSVITEIAITPHTKPSGTGGTNLGYTVDIQVRPSGGAFASIMSLYTVDSTRANGTPGFTVPTTVALNRGDQIQVVIALIGSTGTQGQGLNIDIFTRQRGSGG